ncbi:hypothetical protein [Enterococcus faecalis]|uniref:hypothetical protein n=1 Tax=Enterococcus faecalis TaxID=1351 RepID=UPI000452A3A1|nr:hypothetical protein [Enterococcus faecalis]ETU62891.1 hypothetical protein P026_01922 [Enterococcus faecalis EnGen0426]
MKQFKNNLEMFRYIDAINKEPSREFKIEPLREEIIIEPIEEDVESKAENKKGAKE